MAAFNHPTIIEKLKAFEGGYVNDPKDPGGETCCGIARRDNKKWAGWNRIDAIKAGKPRHMAKAVNAELDALWALALPLYEAKYWEPLRLDGIQSQALALQVFDTSVNMGAGTAAKMLQRAAGVKPVDGKIGPGTLAAVNARPDEVHAKFYELRRARYKAIVRARPSSIKFLKGWLRRAEAAAVA